VLVLGIDPGPTESGYAYVGPRYALDAASKTGNEAMLAMIRSSPPRAIAMESIKSYGKRVGAETFETCRFEGRVLQLCADLKIPCYLYSRGKYGKNFVQDQVVNDSLLRKAIIARFGSEISARLRLKDGKTELRSAFAVAVFHIDQTSRGAVAQ
jgi:hypothetical protein